MDECIKIEVLDFGIGYKIEKSKFCWLFLCFLLENWRYWRIVLLFILVNVENFKDMFDVLWVIVGFDKILWYI